MGNTRDADMDNYISTLEKVLNKFSKAEIVVPGHGNHGGTELLYHTLELIKKYHM